MWKNAVMGIDPGGCARISKACFQSQFSLFACVADQQRAVVSWVCKCTASFFNEMDLCMYDIYTYISLMEDQTTDY